MLQITVNGILTELPAPVTVAEYLHIHNYDPARIAVELNERILSKSDYPTTTLTEADVMEIVSFVGGG